jgi:hypothetical protein
MVALLVVLPILLIAVPILVGYAVERVREQAFDTESRGLKPDFQGFWLNHSNVTYILTSLSSEVV